MSIDLSRTYVAKSFHEDDKFYEVRESFFEKPFFFRTGAKRYWKDKNYFSGWVDFVEGGSTYFLAVEVEEYDG